MRILIFIPHIRQTWISLLFCLLVKSVYVLSQEESLDWIKANDVDYTGPKFVSEGQPFKILCRMSKFYAPKWTKNERPILEMRGFSFENKEGTQQTRIEILSVPKATKEDSGFYRCNSFSRAYHRLDVIPLEERVIKKDSSTQPTLLFEEIKEENSTIVLDCHNIANSDTAEMFWYKNGAKVPAHKNDQRIISEGPKLIIKKATSAIDAGDYMCKVDSLTAMGGSQFGQMIQLRAPIKVTPFPKTKSVVYGTRYQLECNYTGYPFGRIRWLIGNEKLSLREINSQGIEIRPNNEKYPDAVLIIKDIEYSHRNSYTCIVDNNITSDETTVYLTVRANAIQSNGPLLLIEKKTLKISCNLTEDESRAAKSEAFNWFKDNISLGELPKEERDRIVEEKQTLVIKEANKIDIGDYECKTKDGRLSEIVSVRTKPWLHLFDDYQKTNYKSANVIEGEKFYLKCEVIADYARNAKVEWFKYNESEHENFHKVLVPIPPNDPRVKIQEFNLTKSILTIDKVEPSDRFYYVCKASNSISHTNNTILLRVKDKLGALWPFLGIVGEVIILCTIIFIYEKRRIKPDFDESDNDNNPEVKGSQDRSSKSTEVRQRK